MKKKIVILVVLLVGLSTLLFADVTPIASEVFLRAMSAADYQNCPHVVDSNGQSQGTGLNMLTASVNPVSNCNGASVSTIAQVYAAWASADSGLVIFPKVGWSTSNVRNGVALPDLGLDFSYTFLANTSQPFSVAYSIVGGGDTGGFGLNGFDITLTGPNGSSSRVDLNTGGALSWHLISANTYTLTITNRANISAGLGTVTESMLGSFIFYTTPTPEPSSLVLLASGALGLLGAAWRRFKV